MSGPQERGILVDDSRWPRGVSREPTMRISDVLRVLKAEFPSISQSKLRFLEDRGLVEPRRSASGYRQYSLADVERLRYILVEQRDHYLPLKVISEQLAALDEAADGPDARPVMPLAAEEGEDGTYTLAELAEKANVPRAVLDDLVTAGIVRPDDTGHVDEAAYDIAVLAADLAEYGVEARHLRTLRTAADRHIGLVEQIVAPWISQNSPSARAHAAAVAQDVAELCMRLHAVWVRQRLTDLVT